MQETQVQSLGWEVLLEKGMATQSSILAWRILLTEEPGGLQSIAESDTTEQLTRMKSKSKLFGSSVLTTFQMWKVRLQ